ncbi:MAG: PAS domain-containing protein [Kiritimatiellia bacterium]
MTPPKESLRYFALLLLLLTTGAIAAGASIRFLDNAVADVTDRLILTIIIWTLTMGFMLIAGAFGLWTIHFATEAQSLRSISRLVDHMHDIRDGIIAIDKNGKIIGINTAAESLFGAVRTKSIQAVCPPISDADLQTMQHTSDIVEFEFPQQQAQGPNRTLRFRAQPAIAGVSLILVSDITSVAAARARRRRAATLQLAGHMAQGIANDFNDLLCGISGHVSLLQKGAARKPDEVRTSVDAIQLCADRGIKLARQLAHLTQAQLEQSENITSRLAQHVNNGADLLASSLDRHWKIERIIDDNVPPVNIPPSQIEHMIQSLGSIVSETHQAAPGSICICLRQPTPKERASLPGKTAAIIEIDYASPDGKSHPTPEAPEALAPENGVISSLVETLIIQAGGKFEALPDGRRAHHFRLYLPEVDATTLTAGMEQEDTLAIGLEAYTAGWHVLLCMAPERNPFIQQYLIRKNIHLETAENESAFLEMLATPEQHEVIFIQPDLLGQHFASFIHIVARISPESAVVLLTETPLDNVPKHVICISPNSAPVKWMHAMIDARSRRQIVTSEATT